MSNLGYLYAALGVTWGLIALYVYRLYRQQQRLQREPRRSSGCTTGNNRKPSP